MTILSTRVKEPVALDIIGKFEFVIADLNSVQWTMHHNLRDVFVAENVPLEDEAGEFLGSARLAAVRRTRPDSNEDALYSMNLRASIKDNTPLIKASSLQPFVRLFEARLQTGIWIEKEIAQGRFSLNWAIGGGNSGIGERANLRNAWFGATDPTTTTQQLRNEFPGQPQLNIAASVMGYPMQITTGEPIRLSLFSSPGTNLVTGMPSV